MRLRRTEGGDTTPLPWPARLLGAGTVLCAVAFALAALRSPSGRASADPLVSSPAQSAQAPPVAVSSDTTVPTDTAVPATVPSPPSTDPPPARWTLAFGGDTLLTRPVGADADPFARMRPPLADADLAIVNVETAIATVGTAVPAKEFTFRSSTRLPGLLAGAGVDVVSLANNHSLDYGAEAMAETVERLRVAGVEPVGAGADRATALTPASRVVQGQRVAVLAASQIIPAHSWVATERRAGIASAGKHVLDDNTRRLGAAVRAARATHDVVVVVLHWGIEGDPCPSDVQRRVGAYLRRSGATVVLGAHPHVLQPVVADGDGLIAYSLGNFVWGPRTGATADTGVLQVVFDGSRLAGYRFHPHRLDSNGWAAAVSDPARARTIEARVTRACPGAVGTPHPPDPPAV